MEEWCVEGEIFYINKVTGLKFQKGRLGSSSGADNTKNKATTAINKARSTTRTTTKTTKVAKVSTTSVPKPTTRRITPTTKPFEKRVVVKGDIPNRVDEKTPSVTDGAQFSVEYVNTVLEDKVPNLKVLQCWNEFNICFIQIVSRSEENHQEINFIFIMFRNKMIR